MADLYIENSEIRIGVNYHGAELVSIVRKSDGREYMWSGDPVYWGRVSPVLFPFVGKLRDTSYKVGDRVWSGVPQHGYARDSEFRLAEKLEDAVWFELSPDELWRERYPYEFLLRIGYRIEGRSVHVMWTVRNDSPEAMHFSIGAHPAFVFPNGAKMDGYYADLHMDSDVLECGELDEVGLLKPERRQFPMQNGRLALSDDVFAADALIIDSPSIHTVTLGAPEQEPFLQVRFDAPQLGLWSPAGKGAPFVCIEPWFGRSDRVSFDGELKDREYGNTIDPGHSFNKEYVIDIL